jgi:hypothetical protein
MTGNEDRPKERKRKRFTAQLPQNETRDLWEGDAKKKASTLR